MKEIRVGDLVCLKETEYTKTYGNFVAIVTKRYLRNKLDLKIVLSQNQFWSIGTIFTETHITNICLLEDFI